MDWPGSGYPSGRHGYSLKRVWRNHSKTRIDLYFNPPPKSNISFYFGKCKDPRNLLPSGVSVYPTLERLFFFFFTLRGIDDFLGQMSRNLLRIGPQIAYDKIKAHVWRGREAMAKNPAASEELV